MRSLVLLVGATLVAQDVPAVKSPTPTGFVERTLVVAGTEHRYAVYVPPGYVASRPSPLLMFLNGMGECGTDGKKQLTVGLAPAIEKQPQRWPFVVVLPQKPDKQSQWIDHEALVMGALAATEKEFAIDARRRFLTGLSQGGAGTWAIGSRHADVWAAIAPVCGYGTPAAVAPGLAKMPIWAFHGIDDKAVSVQQSKDLCAAVEGAGGSPILTLYPNTPHNSWDKAYRESGLAEWFGMVVEQPVAARYLADPGLLTELKLEVTRVVANAAGEVVRPESASITARGASVSWSFQPVEGEGKFASTSHRNSVSHGEAPIARWQDKPAEETGFAALLGLQRAGLLLRPAGKAVDADAPGHRVDLQFDGKLGPWRWQCFVPAAEPGAEAQRAAIDQVFGFVQAKTR